MLEIVYNVVECLFNIKPLVEAWMIKWEKGNKETSLRYSINEK